VSPSKKFESEQSSFHAESWAL